MINLEHFLVLSAIMFCIGLWGALSKRNIVAIPDVHRDHVQWG